MNQMLKQPPGGDIGLPAASPFDALSVVANDAQALANEGSFKSRSYSVADVASSFELNVPYIVKGVLEQQTTAMLFGESNLGKTFITLDLAMHVAAGPGTQSFVNMGGHQMRMDQRRWFGRRISQGHVIYVATEGQQGFRRRLRGYYVTNPELYAAAAPHITVEETSPNFSSAEDTTRFIEAHKDKNPILVVVDTMAQTLGGGDENSAKDVGLFWANMNRIKLEMGATPLVLHHPGKDASKGARGSSAIRGTLDTNLKLVAASEGILELSDDKQRDNPKDGTIKYRLESVVLGIDQDGDEVTTATVVGVSDEAAKKGKTGTITARNHILALLFFASKNQLTGTQLAELAGMSAKSLRNRLSDLIKDKSIKRATQGVDMMESSYKLMANGKTSHEGYAKKIKGAVLLEQLRDAVQELENSHRGVE